MSNGVKDVTLREVADICDGVEWCEECPFTVLGLFKRNATIQLASYLYSDYKCIFNLPPVAWDTNLIEDAVKEYRGKEHVESVCGE